MFNFISNWRRELALFLAICVISCYFWFSPRPPETTFVVRAPAATVLEDGSSPQSLIFEFSRSAARLDLVGKVIQDLPGNIELTPKIAGNWKWENDRRLVFSPSLASLDSKLGVAQLKEDWKPSTIYTVTFGKTIFQSEANLSNFKHSFSTAPFSARLIETKFYQDVRDSKIKRVIATFKFSHPVDRSSFEKRLSLLLKPGTTKAQAAFLDGFRPSEMRPTSFDVTYDEFDGQAFVHSANLDIPPDDYEMQVNLNLGVVSSRGGNPIDLELEGRVTVPGMFSYFKVNSLIAGFVRNIDYEPERIISIQTSTPVSQLELAKNLSVYLLPVDLPAFQGRRSQKDFFWLGNEALIGPEILSQSIRIEADFIPVEHDSSTENSFKVNAPVGRHIFVRLNSGTRASGEYLLSKEFGRVLAIEAFPKEIKILGEGALLSLSGSKSLSVMTRDVEAVQIEIWRVMPDKINQLVSQSYGNFQNPQFWRGDMTVDGLAERFVEIRTTKRESGKANYISLDFEKLLSNGLQSPRGIFYIKIHDWDEANKAVGQIEDARLILVTDLGVLVKDSQDGTHDIFVQSLSRAAPVAGASVEVLGLNGINILKIASDISGHVSLPKLSDFTREKQPVAYVVRNGTDLAFLPFERDDRQLQFSRYDVGGLYTPVQDPNSITTRADSLQAYLFSERGIYRPGDELRAAIIVRLPKWEKLEGIPLEAVLSDVKGRQVKSQKFNFQGAGVEEFNYKTDPSAATGNFHLDLYVTKENGRRGVLLNSLNFRVEEFLPDRMRIQSRFSGVESPGWIAPDSLKALIDLNTLYGTPAQGHLVKARLTLSPAYPIFNKYQDFRFSDPELAKKSFSEELGDSLTNLNGRAEFDLNLKRFDRATYRVSVYVQGFEAGAGRFVASQNTVLVSSMPYLVGFRADGALEYLPKGADRNLSLIAINSNLESLDVSPLTASLVSRNFASVLTKQPNGTFSYQSVRKEIPINSRTIEIKEGGSQFTLDTSEPGDFALVISDTPGHELSRIEYSVSGAANLTASLERNAVLDLRLDKAEYANGEEIEVQIKAPYSGSGLITIEREKVYSHKWFTAETTSSVQHITVPAGLEGNGYINVSFVRAPDSKEIYMSPLSYGVVAFNVSRASRTNNLKLSFPKEVLPGSEVEVAFSPDLPGKIILFAVDEGILQLTKYKTPNPLGHFFQKRALEVDTRQILDLILPDYDIARSVAAAGGDRGESLGQLLNPFKRKLEAPVAFWSGIMDANVVQGGATQYWKFRVPDYFNGSIRVIGVIASEDRIGVAEGSLVAKGPYVISPNVPTFLTPGDEVSITTTVTNTAKDTNVEKISLALATSDALEVLGASQQDYTIDDKSPIEQVLTFKLKAKSVLGNADLKWHLVDTEGREIHLVNSLSIRPSMPFETKLSGGVLKNTSKELKPSRQMYPEFRKLEGGVGLVPIFLAKGLNTYLQNYQYSCTEQLVSQALAPLVLSKHPEFGLPQQSFQHTIDKIIEILLARQNAAGAFGHWSSNSESDLFSSIYAINFLIELDERGFALPAGLMENSTRLLHSVARKSLKVGTSADLEELRIRAYAIYLLTRRQIVTGKYLEMLLDDLTVFTKRNQLDPDHWTSDLLAAYIAASYKLLKDDSKAEGFINKVLFDTTITEVSWNYDSLIHNSQLLVLLSRHFPSRAGSIDPAVVSSIADAIIANNYSTLSAAYAVLALDSLANEMGNPGAQAVQVSQVKVDQSNNEKIDRVELGNSALVSFDVSPETKTIRFEAYNDKNLYFQLEETGYESRSSTQEARNGIEVSRQYRNAAGEVVNQIRLGEKLYVHLQVHALNNKILRNIAVTELFPAGFEADLSFGQAHSSLKADQNSWKPEYVDRREDRLLVFGTVDGTVREYVYVLIPTNSGVFGAPPILAESMYDRRIVARGVSSQLEVLSSKPN